MKSLKQVKETREYRTQNNESSSDEQYEKMAMMMVGIKKMQRHPAVMRVVMMTLPLGNHFLSCMIASQQLQTSTKITLLK